MSQEISTNTAYSSTLEFAIPPAYAAESRQDEATIEIAEDKPIGYGFVRGENTPVVGMRRFYTWRSRHSSVAVAVVFLTGLLLAVGLITFGAIEGNAMRTTGLHTWSPGYRTLYRICEGTTESNTAHVHTCNVFQPNQDLNSEPVHSFTENIRAWGGSTGSTSRGSQQAGSAFHTPSRSLQSLLATRNLTCSITSAPLFDRPKVQIIIGDAAFIFGKYQTATACNYDQKGRNLQKYCGLYTDAGTAAVPKPRPRSINSIFLANFGASCEYISGPTTIVTNQTAGLENLDGTFGHGLDSSFP